MVAIDIDGTLIPPLVDFDELRARVRELLGVDHPLRPLGESLAGLALDGELLERAWGLIEEAELASVDRLDPEEVAENVGCVRGLASAGVGVVFVTARSGRTAEMILLKLGLSDVAEAVVSRDYSPLRLRQLEMVARLAEGRRVLFVGDTAHDEESARSLGIPFVRVQNYRELPKAIGHLARACVGSLSEPGGL